MNNNKKTKKEQLDAIENQQQEQIHSLTHSEMMQSLHSKFFKNNPNSLVMMNPVQEEKNENLIEVTFFKTIKKNIKMNNANNKKRKENIDKKNELNTNQKSTMSAGEKFLEDLQNLPYSTDRIRQGFVIHISIPIRDEKKYNK